MKNPFGIRRLATGIAVFAAAGLTASSQVVFTGMMCYLHEDSCFRL